MHPAMGPGPKLGGCACRASELLLAQSMLRVLGPLGLGLTAGAPCAPLPYAGHKTLPYPYAQTHPECNVEGFLDAREPQPIHLPNHRSLSCSPEHCAFAEEQVSDEGGSRVAGHFQQL